MHAIETLKKLNDQVVQATENGNPPASWPTPVAAEQQPTTKEED
jgi:hypothetical protein